MHLLRRGQKDQNAAPVSANHRVSINQPHQRVKTDQCENCKKYFGILSQQHECKRCLRAICKDCGREKAIIPTYDDKTVHRICVLCKEDQAMSKELRSRHMTFGRNSVVAKKWLQSLYGDELNEAKVDKEYAEALQRLQSQNNDTIKTAVQQYMLYTYNDVKNEMNYSFYEVHFILTKKEHDEYVLSKITNVLSAFFVSNPVKVTKNLIFIILFLLYFCSEATAYKILLSLHQEIIPIRFQYHKIKDETIPLEAEVQFILQMLDDQQDIDKKVAKNFLDTYSTQYLSYLYINRLTFTMSFQIVDFLITQKQFIALEKGLAVLFKMHYQNIVSTKIDMVQDMIVRQTRFDDFKENFPITQSRLTPSHRGSIVDMPQGAKSLVSSQNLQTQALAKSSTASSAERLSQQEPIESTKPKEIEILEHLNQLLKDDTYEARLSDSIQDESRLLFMKMQSKVKAIAKNGADQKKKFKETQILLQKLQSENAMLLQKQELREGEDSEFIITKLEQEVEKQKTMYFELQTELIQTRKHNQQLSRQTKDSNANSDENSYEQLIMQQRQENTKILQKLNEQQLKNRQLTKANQDLQNEIEDLKTHNFDYQGQLSQAKHLITESQVIIEDLKRRFEEQSQLLSGSQTDDQLLKNEYENKMMERNLAIYNLKFDVLKAKDENLQLHDKLSSATKRVITLEDQIQDNVNTQPVVAVEQQVKSEVQQEGRRKSEECVIF